MTGDSYKRLDDNGLEAAIRECARITAPKVSDEEYSRIKADNSPLYQNTRAEVARVVTAYLSAADPVRAGEVVADFKPTYLINEALNLIEVVFEDRRYTAVPLIDGVNHWIDKHVADNGDVVGLTFWIYQPLKAVEPTPDTSVVAMRELKRELEDCKSAVVSIETHRKPGNETQMSNYHFYRGRVASLQFAIEALAAANQSDGGVTEIGPYPGEDDAGNVGVVLGLSDAEFHRNLRHWKEECGKLHSQIAAKNAALDTALGALQIARVWIHKEQKRAPVLRAIEQIKRMRQ